MIEDIYYTPQMKAQHISYQYSVLDSLFREKQDEFKVIAEKQGYENIAEMLEHNKYNWKIFINSNCQAKPLSLAQFRRATAPKEYGAMITIALKDVDSMPEPEVLEEKLQDEKYIFSYEYFSGKDNHLNPHIHIFIYGDKHKGNTIKKFARFFKIEPNFVDFVKKYDVIQNRNAIQYIKGEKKEEKRENSLLDDEYREKSNIKKYYTNI